MSSKIKDGLFMGDIDAAQDADFLQLNGIVHVINCVPRQVPNIFQQSLGMSYTVCDLNDALQRPFFDLKNGEFMRIIHLIDQFIERADSVLVHSLNGTNRSPSIMIGYLMVKYCWGLDKAHEFVLTKRTDVKLHESYINQLCSLEAQILQYRSARATECQVYEWNTHSADPNTDEVILVHTFLNTRNVLDKNSVSERRLVKHNRGTSHERRLTWIDQTPDMRELHPSLLDRPERPPNNSYNKMIAADGWLDLLDSPPTLVRQTTRTAKDADANLLASRMAFVDLSSSLILKHESLTESRYMDQSELSFDRTFPIAPLTSNNKRFNCILAATRNEILDDEVSTSPSTVSDDSEINSSHLRYLRDTITSTNSRLRRQPSTRFSLCQSSTNTSKSDAIRGFEHSKEAPTAASKKATKKSGMTVSATNLQSSSIPAKVRISTNLSTQQSRIAPRSRSHVRSDSVSSSVSHPLSKHTSTPVRPRSAPPRIRRDDEMKDLQSRTVDKSGISRMRLHSSLDFTNTPELDISSIRRNSVSFTSGDSRAKTVRASWR